MYRAALTSHHGSQPPMGAGKFLSHDGWKYDTSKERAEADKTFHKSGGEHGRNTHDRSDKWYGNSWRSSRSKSRDSRRGQPWVDRDATNNSTVTDNTTAAPAPTSGGDAACGPGDAACGPAVEPAAVPAPEITRFACGRFTVPHTAAGHFAGVTCKGCDTDCFSQELCHRLCSICRRQFPEDILSYRLRQAPFAAGEIDPESPVGLLQLGTASTSITTAAAANICTSDMVDTLPKDTAVGKTGNRAHVKASSIQSRARMAIVTTQYEWHRDECIRTKEQPSQTCLDSIKQL